MAKLLTLKKNSEFSRVYQKGKSVADKYLVVYWFPKRKNEVHFGFSISKRIGGAVTRNRLRRLIKEVCRKKQNHLKPDIDIIIIARKPVVGRDYFQVETSLISLFKKAKLIKEEENA